MRGNAHAPLPISSEFGRRAGVNVRTGRGVAGFAEWLAVRTIPKNTRCRMPRRTKVAWSYARRGKAMATYPTPVHNVCDRATGYDLHRAELFTV